MNKKPLLLLLAIACGSAVLGIQAVWGQSLNDYLQDKDNTVLRIELVSPPEALATNQTFFGRLRSFLGIRNIARIRPEVGTKLIVQASAYASSPYQTDSTPCITAVGTRVRPGVVATNFLPMGTLLEINGQEFIVEDRMNSRYDGYYLDVWFPSTSTALQFGRKQIAITITGYGDPGQEIRVADKTKEEEDSKTSEETKASIWERFQSQLASVGELLGARRSSNVDQHDIDCFSEDKG